MPFKTIFPASRMAQSQLKERLVVFTRYPKPGKTKTRLIDALGKWGAAELHRHLVSHTVQQANQLVTQRSVSVVVCFADGNVSLMQQWLGTELSYCSQIEGDLGKRLEWAFHEAFADGMRRVAVIGSDSPELTTDILHFAFDELLHKDLVIGPALDGGYYLIGLRCPLPQIFENIPWGTGDVLERTTAAAKKLGVTPVQLPTLRDVDRPEDLSLCDQWIPATRSP